MSESTFYPQYQRQKWAEYRISQIPALLTRPVYLSPMDTFVIHVRQIGSVGIRSARPVVHSDVIALKRKDPFYRLCDFVHAMR